MKAWLLTDDRAGNVNQVLGVAEALGVPYERKEIRYDKWIKLPNFLRGKSLLGVDEKSKEGIGEPFPDVVIGAGRRVYPVARYIKKHSPKTKVVQIMNPGLAGFREADMIVLPRHDKVIAPFKIKNVMRVLGAPHRVTSAKLEAERAKWEDKLCAYPSPRVSVIVGGGAKKPFTKWMAEDLVEKLLNMKAGSFLITTSRRTPKEVVDILEERLPKEMTYLYKFGNKDENPYFGLLACADQIVVTGDSISMCSESCAAGVPVSIFAPYGTMPKKHQSFHSQLYAAGYATELGAGQVAFGGRLNASEDVAAKVKTILAFQNENENVKKNEIPG